MNFTGHITQPNKKIIVVSVQTIMMQFPVSYEEILKRIDKVNPKDYAGSRNFIDGDITYLSPYISRGVISIKQLAGAMFAKGYTFSEMEKFIQQLAWREYFQRIWQQLEDDMFDDIRRWLQEPFFLRKNIKNIKHDRSRRRCSC